MSKKQTSPKPPIVIGRHGEFRFQRGMITARLLRRGISMETAFETSRALRERLMGRVKITTAELKVELAALLVEKYGIEPGEKMLPGRVPLIRTGVYASPFSRAVIVRRLLAAGLEMEVAMSTTEEIKHQLRAHGQRELSADIANSTIMGVINEKHGAGIVRRYRVTTLSFLSSTPLLIFLGGSAGTGKSTVATELAYRLGIRKVTSTDLVRETMRTVLSAQVVPGLHDHSFRGIIQGRQVLSDPRERVLAGFRQQAEQVKVGVRGVIARAIQEGTSMIIEGVHLLPPYDDLLPLGADIHVAGVTLAVTNPKEHKARFIERAREQTTRGPHAYLEAFQSVRWIHDDLVRMADESEGLVLHNQDMGQTITDVVDYLSHIVLDSEMSVPPSRVSALETSGKDLRTLLLILDGLGDEPIPELGDLTPLAAANTPNLAQLAGAGGQGLLLIREPDNDLPDTALGLTTLLYEKHQPMLGRGLLEALGSGIQLTHDMILFRGNLATLGNDGVILDRRAGRIRTGISSLLADLKDILLPGGVQGSIFPGHEHRVVVVLKGNNLSPAISDTDPGIHTVMERPCAALPLEDTDEARRTATALTALLTVVRQKLEEHPLNTLRIEQNLRPANAILTRGAESADVLGTIPRPSRLSAMISACPTALGVARAAGISPISSARMTGNLDTDLDEKLNIAARLLEDHEFISIHFKGSDVAAHDQQPLQKRDYIARVDEALGRFFEKIGEQTENLRIVVTGDHGTSSLTGVHLKDPVPLLLGKWDPDAEPAEFNERSATHGALGLIHENEFAQLLWSGPKDGNRT
jgi:2,3-bisphosphoglycerate-independent phosphoglycerate mutase